MKFTHKQPTVGRFDQAANWVVAGTLVVVPFHAFLTVWAATAVGHFTALRLWDEAALAALVLYSVRQLVLNKQLRTALVSNRLVRAIAVYIVLTLLLGMVAYVKHQVVAEALSYALIINLRFLVWLLAVWIAASQSDWLARHWRRLVFIPLGITVVFGLLQFFALPHDFLRHFGYNKSGSYAASVTLNQDSSTIRVQSFLRGANPFGAYLAGLLALVLVYVRPARTTWRYWLLGILVIAALALTFSRSAWIGALLAALLVGLYRLRNNLKYAALGIVVLLVLASVAAAVLRHSGGVQDALLHHSAHSTATVTSNQGHESAFHNSLKTLQLQPLGDGPGTAGQASVYNGTHGGRNTESFWLQLGLETGWPGMVLFAVILCLLGVELWARRAYRLPQALLFSLIGLAVVNLISYAWADDTLAFVWWGMAGIALALPRKENLEVQT